MSDLISRAAAIRKYQEVCNGIKCGECPFLIKVNTEKGSHVITDCKLEAFLHNLPSAQPERKKGHWVEIGDEPYDEWECDVCGFVIDGSGCIDPEEYRDVYRFCPRCGSDMRGEQDG